MRFSAAVLRPSDLLPALVLTAVIALTTSAALAQPPDAVRVDGEDAIAYGVTLSQATFDDAGGPRVGAFMAVIGRDDDFADSLAAGPLLSGGPLLYVPGGEGGALPDSVATELQRVLPPASTVYIAGGVAAVSADIETAIEDLGFIVERLAGEERTATAAAIATEAEQLFGAADRVLVALAGNWPDAVAGGALAASEQLPLLLTDGEELSQATIDWISDHPGAEVVVLGGEAVITQAVYDAAGAARRLAGETRAHTAAAMLGEFGEGVTGTAITQGFVDDGWVQGNAGAALLQPLLLSGPGPDELNPVVTGALSGRDGPLFILGGTDRVSETALEAAEDAREG